MKKAKSRIKIVFYDEGAQGSTQLGGGQLARLELMQNLNQEKFQPILLTSQEGELTKAARAKGIEGKVYPINTSNFQRFKRKSILRNPLSLFKMIFQSIGAAFRLAKVLKRLQPDILHPNENLSRLVTLLSSPLYRVPKVMHIDNEWDKGLIDSIMARVFTMGFDRMIAVSSRVQDIALRYANNQDKIIKINPGFKLNRFVGLNSSYVRRVVDASKGEMLLATIGKLIEFKGQAFTMECLSELKPMLPPFRYLLIGDGPDRELLKSHAKKMGLENEVTFLGQRDDVPELIAGLDLLVQPSQTESFGLTLVEGLLAGTLVVASNAGGAKEILENGNLGWITPARNKQQLKIAIKEALHLPFEEKQALVKKGRSSAAERFSMEQSVQKTEQVYFSLLKRQRSCS